MTIRSSGWLAVLFATALLLTPALVLVLARGTASHIPPELRTPAVPIVVDATRSVNNPEYVTIGVLEWATVPPLTTSLSSGVVTAVLVQEGSVLKTGTPVVSIDGIDRIAVASDRPFYRPLSRGARGSDVAELQTILKQLGYYADVIDGVFGRQLQTAVADLREDLGALRAPATFDPSLVIWIPAEGLAIGEVNSTVGYPAQALGQPIASLAPTLTAVHFETPSGMLLELRSDLQYLFRFGTDEISVDAGSSIVRKESLELIEASVDPDAQTIEGVVFAARPQPTFSVPASAVVMGGQGELCVWTPRTQGFESVTVDVVDATVGIANLSSADGLENGVLTNPVTVLEQHRCPSS